MKLQETFGRKIKILCLDGGAIEGRVIDYIPTIEEDERKALLLEMKVMYLLNLLSMKLPKLKCFKSS